MSIIKNFDKFSNISENVRYHIKNEISFLENVFRPGSESFYDLLKEVRGLYESKDIDLSGIDKELYETTDIGKSGIYEGEEVPLDLPSIVTEEAEYKGREVELNKPKRSSGPKKYKVYVKNPKTGNINIVNFGDEKGGLTAKVNDKEARDNFVSRHNCKDKKDKMTAGYWSCRLPKFKNLVNTEYSGYW